MYDVRTFQASGNGRDNDRAALQAAIDACAEAGGGTVYFPAGTYLTGTLRLRSRVTLHLEAGCVLQSSRDPNDYEEGPRKRSRHLLVADEVEKVGIVGRGVLEGTGEEDFALRWGVVEEPEHRFGVVLFQDCRDVVVRDITIRNSDAWTLHFRRCDHLLIDGVRILNNLRHTNSDGIDPNGCRDVRISNCHIVAGDDAIVLKAGDGRPCEDVTVTNCVLETTCTGVKFGSESAGDFRNIRVSNCVIRHGAAGISFHIADGATAERIGFSNIAIETSLPSTDYPTLDAFRQAPFYERLDPATLQIQSEGDAPYAPWVNFQRYPIMVDICRRKPESRLGLIRDVSFCDIDIATPSKVLIQGMIERPFENVRIRNMTLRATAYEDWSTNSKVGSSPHVGTTREQWGDKRNTCYARQPSYVTVAHVNGLRIDGLTVEPPAAKEIPAGDEPRKICSLHYIDGGEVRGVWRAENGRYVPDPSIAMHESREVRIVNG